MLTNTGLLAAVWVLSVVVLFQLWRHLSSFNRQIKIRYRFYELRDRCVALIRSGIMSEDDPLFQRYYKYCNTFASDAAYILDIHEFVRHAEKAMNDSSKKEEFERLKEEIEKRPQEFQDLVLDFYSAVWISIVESNTILQVALALTLIVPPCKKLVAKGVRLCKVSSKSNKRLPEYVRFLFESWSVSKQARTASCSLRTA